LIAKGLMNLSAKFNATTGFILYQFYLNFKKILE
jgi:hypothetical protein